MEEGGEGERHRELEVDREMEEMRRGGKAEEGKKERIEESESNRGSRGGGRQQKRK